MLAREAQTDRSAALLDVAPFPENVADDMFTSPYYEHLESAIARPEAHARRRPGRPCSAAGRHARSGHSEAPARQRTRARVAGLIPAPAGPIADDMQTALTQRQALIKTAARRLLHDVHEAGAAWVTKLGQPSACPEAQERWEARAATVALYRCRYGVTGPSPVGDPQSARTPEQAAEHRIAQSALARVRQLSTRTGSSQPPSIDRVRRL